MLQVGEIAIGKSFALAPASAPAAAASSSSSSSSSTRRQQPERGGGASAAAAAAGGAAGAGVGEAGGAAKERYLLFREPDDFLLRCFCPVRQMTRDSCIPIGRKKIERLVIDVVMSRCGAG